MLEGYEKSAPSCGYLLHLLSAGVHVLTLAEAVLSLASVVEVRLAAGSGAGLYCSQCMLLLLAAEAKLWGCDNEHRGQGMVR
jgi:hypothetical protein